jgi:phosphoglucomutase
MVANPRAGQPAQPEDLVDLPHLVTSYYALAPDPDDVAQQVAFGTSGHRGSALNGAFNEAHILAITQAIVEYRAAQGTTGPLFIGRDTHGLSEPAWVSALEVLAANDIVGTRRRRRSATRSSPTTAAAPRRWPTGSW